MRRFVPEKWGGTECVVHQLSRSMIKRGTACVIFCTNMLSRTGSETFDNVPVRRFSYCFPWLGLSRNAKAQLELKGGSPLALPLFFALLREPGLSLIHTHVQHRLGGMARTVAKLRGIPYVVSIHGGYFTLPREQVDKMTKPFRGKLEWGKVFGFLFGSRRVVADADAILCVGRDEYEQCTQRFPDKTIHYIPNGVDIERFQKADAALFREHYAIKPHEKIVLCVSRIDYQKNQLGLIRAFAAFAKEHTDHRLILIGAATVQSYIQEVRKLIQQLGLKERTTLIEGLRPDDPLLPSAYRAADQFVLPTHHEPFGIVVLEAWAACCPVIAYSVGGLARFTENETNALLVECDDEPALAMAMGRLESDPALRNQLIKNAYAEATEHYDWAKITERVLNIYSELTNK